MLSPPRHLARAVEGVVGWFRENWLNVAIATAVCIATSLTGLWWMMTCTSGCPPDTREAEIEIGNLSNMVESYYLMTDPHRLPDSLDDLPEMENLVKGGEIPKDPWENDYVYVKCDVRTGTGSYVIMSRGPDELLGTEDDISSERPRDYIPPAEDCSVSPN